MEDSKVLFSGATYTVSIQYTFNKYLNELYINQFYLFPFYSQKVLIICW